MITLPRLLPLAVPDFGAVSGSDQLRAIVGALLTYGLVTAALMVVVCGAAWAIGSAQGSWQTAGKAKVGALGSPRRSGPHRRRAGVGELVVGRGSDAVTEAHLASNVSAPLVSVWPARRRSRLRREVALMTLAEESGTGIDQHPEWHAETHEWSERDCRCYVGPPSSPGLSGHEFSPFDDKGVFVRKPCARPGLWRGLWQCGGCPDTHTVLVCDQCRSHHDADAATGVGATLMWVIAQD